MGAPKVCKDQRESAVVDGWDPTRYERGPSQGCLRVIATELAFLERACGGRSTLSASAAASLRRKVPQVNVHKPFEDERSSAQCGGVKSRFSVAPRHQANGVDLNSQLTSISPALRSPGSLFVPPSPPSSLSSCTPRHYVAIALFDGNRRHDPR